MAMVRARVVVTGRVQGVYYRSYAEDEARRLSLRGWVRNRGDGAVEMTIEGEERDAQAMIAWSRQGSPLSRVEDVQVDWEPYTGEFSGFGVSYLRGGNE